MSASESAIAPANNSQRVILLTCGVGRPKPNSAPPGSGALSMPPSGVSNAFDLTNVETCEATFWIDSDAAGHDFKLKTMTGKEYSFDVSLSKPQAGATSAARSAARIITLSVKTTLLAAAANTKRVTWIRVRLGRPVSQKPDSTFAASVSSTRPTLDAFGFKETDTCEAAFALESDAAEYDIDLAPISGKECKFDVNLSKPAVATNATTNAPKSMPVFDLNVKITLPAAPVEMNEIDAIS